MQQLGYNHPKLVDVDTFCCEACRHILLLMPFGMCYFLTGKYDQIWIGKIKQFAIWIGKKNVAKSELVHVPGSPRSQRAGWPQTTIGGLGACRERVVSHGFTFFLRDHW